MAVETDSPKTKGKNQKPKGQCTKVNLHTLLDGVRVAVYPTSSAVKSGDSPKPKGKHNTGILLIPEEKTTSL